MTTLIKKLLQQNCYLTEISKCIFTITKFSITQSLLIYDGKADSKKKQQQN